MSKQVHADLIHAWADGAHIQKWNDEHELWVDDPVPDWMPHSKYRIGVPRKRAQIVFYKSTDGAYGAHVNLDPENESGTYVVNAKPIKTFDFTWEEEDA